MDKSGGRKEEERWRRGVSKGVEGVRKGMEGKGGGGEGRGQDRTEEKRTLPSASS